jgi:hypothetical protein
MTPKIQSIDLNNSADIELPAEHQEESPTTPPTDVPGPDVPNDIDTDELEALLVDLKETKKRNKAPPKKRTRKPKAVVPEPVIEAPVVVEEIPEPVVEADVKPKRKYVRKPVVVPPPAPLESQEPEPAFEPAQRRAGAMIEEMQRAERALRYQMRKNKMQTLITQAF